MAAPLSNKVRKLLREGKGLDLVKKVHEIERAKARNISNRDLPDTFGEYIIKIAT